MATNRSAELLGDRRLQHVEVRQGVRSPASKALRAGSEDAVEVGAHLDQTGHEGIVGIVLAADEQHVAPPTGWHVAVERRIQGHGSPNRHPRLAMSSRVRRSCRGRRRRAGGESLPGVDASRARSPLPFDEGRFLLAWDGEMEPLCSSAAWAAPPAGGLPRPRSLRPAAGVLVEVCPPCRPFPPLALAGAIDQPPAPQAGSDKRGL